MLWANFVSYGDIAARLACEAAVEYIVNNYKGFHSETRMLKDALKTADNAIATKGLAASSFRKICLFFQV